MDIKQPGQVFPDDVTLRSLRPTGQLHVTLLYDDVVSGILELRNWCL